jgi:pyruvate ferredoxin oxidoreductase gamma subunit/2-oxoisovalerate ferredoxin oxidoreductase gamma subunit
VKNILIEIRFHGRGGQGAVTAGVLMVYAMNKEGKWAQSFPFFGGERRGAPVMAFLRIDDERIYLHQQIYEPDCCVVLDGDLAKTFPWGQGLKKNSVAILNWPFPFDELKLPENVSKVGYVNAVEVSNKAFGRRAFPITNTTMLGALAKTTGWVKVDSLADAIRHQWSGRIAEANVNAIQMAFDATEVKEV